MTDNALLRRREVERRTGLSRSTIYALVASEQFPAPIRVTANTTAWLAGEVDAWIRDRIAASRRTPAERIADHHAGRNPVPSTGRMASSP